jgi:hypothetical protein
MFYSQAIARAAAKAKDKAWRLHWAHWAQAKDACCQLVKLQPRAASEEKIAMASEAATMHQKHQAAPPAGHLGGKRKRKQANNWARCSLFDF